MVFLLVLAVILSEFEKLVTYLIVDTQALGSNPSFTVVTGKFNLISLGISPLGHKCKCCLFYGHFCKQGRLNGPSDPQR